jgi:alkylation response protein AidB-like acyl-CoA dehydrogenase
MSDLETYRLRARSWLGEMAPKFGREARRGLTLDEDVALGRAWQKAKYEAGYAGIAWKTEDGGQGLTVLEKLAFEQEEMPHRFPNVYFGVSLGMPVPIVLRHGPLGWKRERAIAALKGLRTKAVRDGDAWVLTGQKLWTSWAQLSDYGVIVARTDSSVPKHKGLTYFWVDMRSPGVSVRPVKLAAGDSHVNEVFFDEVRIDDAQRMGAVGSGFAVAMETLFIERYQAQDSAGFGPPLSLFVDLVRDCYVEGRPALSDGRVRQQVARNYAMRSALEAISKQALLTLAAGREPGPEGALNKLVSVRSRQRLSEFAIDLMGVAGIRRDDTALANEDWVESWISAPTGRIAGGADEMLLNTIAEKILGLPQDHRPDKNVAFSDIP